MQQIMSRRFQVQMMNPESKQWVLCHSYHNPKAAENYAQRLEGVFPSDKFRVKDRDDFN